MLDIKGQTATGELRGGAAPWAKRTAEENERRWRDDLALLKKRRIEEDEERDKRLYQRTVETSPDGFYHMCDEEVSQKVEDYDQAYIEECREREMSDQESRHGNDIDCDPPDWFDEMIQMEERLRDVCDHFDISPTLGLAMGGDVDIINHNGGPDTALAQGLRETRHWDVCRGLAKVAADIRNRIADYLVENADEYYDKWDGYEHNASTECRRKFCDYIECVRRRGRGAGALELQAFCKRFGIMVTVYDMGRARAPTPVS